MIDKANKVFYVLLDVENSGTTPLDGPFRLVIDEASITFINNDGETDSGVPYFSLESDTLQAGERETLKIEFERQRARSAEKKARAAIKRGKMTFNGTLQQEKSGDWQLVWNDEFNGNSIDSSKWNTATDCSGGGNDEQQCYTDRDLNVSVSNGVLELTALRETFTGPAEDGGWTTATITQPYTSGKLTTFYKGDWKYGRFEIRAKLPSGQGTWPAFWMLPTYWVFGGWPASGEIDIMEAVNLSTLSDEWNAVDGEIERRIYSTLHYGAEWPDNQYSAWYYKLPEGANPADDYHVYAIEWEDGEIRWYVDGIHYATQTSDGWYSQYLDEAGNLITGAGSAPFNQDFHLILNLAIGGSWATNVNEFGIDESIFPQTLSVDYVRVYNCPVDPETGKGCATIGEDAVIVEGYSEP
jgi:beta-glucanase (GH16 family)